MTFRDLAVISTGNMWRMKVRAILTMTGVLIAIAAFVSMVSFGAGAQQTMEEEYNKLGLFTTMQVLPQKKVNDRDTNTYARLDEAALEKLAAIPGVNLVYPYDAINIKVMFGDSIVSTRAQALPAAAIRTKLFSDIIAGKPFDSDTSRNVIVSLHLLEDLGITRPDSIIGLPLVVYVKTSQIDSGLSHILMDKGESIIERARKIRLDSLWNNKAYRNRIIRQETNAIANRFMSGFMNAQETVTDTLIVAGVRDMAKAGGRLRIEPVIIPFSTAGKFRSSGFSGNPADLFAAFSSGSILFPTPGSSEEKTFSQVTLDIDPHVLQTTIKDSVEKLGYKTFSFALQFEEMQKFFYYFQLALSVVGLIALFTASLGIVNTMVMSISERRKEIGILKSLGADDREIQGLFLVESGVIGFFGTVVGILFGWSITRVVTMVAHYYMRREGVTEFELFALPWYLIGIALAVGIGVSVLAGLLPARRAAKVDPVMALRND